jgi:Holliday junction resolvase-like predicted endonuclease
MNHLHRDRVMRAYFEGRDWDQNPEFQLKRQLVLEGASELSAFPYLLDDEWEVVPGATEGGRGDLLFGDGQGGYAVVEVKYMNPLGGGRTARTARNKKRKKVEEQARTYAEAVRRQHPGAEVRAFVLTDDWLSQGLREVHMSGEGAAADQEEAASS